MEYKYKTKMVCSQEISFNIDGNVITNIAFRGGCNGNLMSAEIKLDLFDSVQSPQGIDFQHFQMEEL